MGKRGRGRGRGAAGATPPSGRPKRKRRTRAKAQGQQTPGQGQAAAAASTGTQAASSAESRAKVATSLVQATRPGVLRAQAPAFQPQARRAQAPVSPHAPTAPASGAGSATSADLTPAKVSNPPPGARETLQAVASEVATPAARDGARKGGPDPPAPRLHAASPQRRDQREAVASVSQGGAGTTAPARAQAPAASEASTQDPTTAAPTNEGNRGDGAPEAASGAVSGAQDAEKGTHTAPRSRAELLRELESLRAPSSEEALRQGRVRRVDADDVMQRARNAARHTVLAAHGSPLNPWFMSGGPPSFRPQAMASVHATAQGRQAAAESLFPGLRGASRKRAQPGPDPHRPPAIAVGREGDAAQEAGAGEASEALAQPQGKRRRREPAWVSELRRSKRYATAAAVRVPHGGPYRPPPPPTGACWRPQRFGF